MNPRTVLHVVGSSGREAFGVSRFVWDVAPAMPGDRYTFQLLFLGPTGPAVEESFKRGITAYATNWLHPSRLSGALRTWHLLRGQKIDLIHQHYGGRTVTRWLKISAGVPIVAHMCGRVPEEAWQSGPRRFDMSRFDAVTAVSRAVAACSFQMNAEVVYPAIPAVAAPRIRPAGAPMSIGSASRLVPLKGLQILISAFATIASQHPEARLMIAGDGPDRDQLQRVAKEIGVADRVQFLGWLENMDEFFRGLDVFVQPSLEEAFGMSAAEAMSHGVPVITTDAGGLAEVAVHGESGMMVPAGDANALGAALNELLADAELRKRLGAAAWQRIRQHFSPERAAVNLTRIYDSVLSVRANRTSAH